MTLIMQRALVVALATVIISGIAAAQPRVDGPSLFVDLADYVGTEVILTGGTVFGADNSGALVKSGGATFKMTNDDMDRETLRFLLKHCSGILGGQTCGVALHVTPTGQRTPFGNMPILKAVRIAK